MEECVTEGEDVGGGWSEWGVGFGFNRELGVGT